jgi:hypothetical protein
VSPPRTEFSELAAEPRTVQVPLSHLSIELGHLYMEDFDDGPEFLRAHFERVRPWADVARQVLPGIAPKSRPRVSMCFMVDDYFTRFSSPAKVLPHLIAAANDAGLSIDYLARESGCAEAEGVALAELVRGRLVADPPPGTNGTRPPVEEIGWLCNGQRSPTSEPTEALRAIAPWQAPVENGARNHSVFIDVELWDQRRDDWGPRRWSCSFLAAVWQLLRLGLLRDRGKPVVVPQEWFIQPVGSAKWHVKDFPEDWDELPPIVQVKPKADPFSAYQTLSVLGSRFLAIESAVQTILQRVDIDDAVRRQVIERSDGERISLPHEVGERVAYVFLTGNRAG